MRTKEEIIKAKTISVFDELQGGHSQIMWEEVMDEYAKEVALDFLEWARNKWKNSYNHLWEEIRDDFKIPRIKETPELFQLYQQEKSKQ